MKIEFPALESEPLIYFLFHSGVFVIVLGSVFFLLGLCMGWLVWARYKRSHRLLLAEQDRLQEEVITLKKKLAEQAIRPVPVKTPKVPAVNDGPEEQAAAALTMDPLEMAASGAESRLSMPALGKEKTVPESVPMMPALTHHETAGINGIRKGLALSSLRVPQVKSAASTPLIEPRPRHIPLLDEETNQPFKDDAAGQPVEPFSFLMSAVTEDKPVGASEGENEDLSATGEKTELEEAKAL